MNTTSLPDHTRLPGHHYSLGEMRGFIADMRVINAQFYNLCFLGRMGSSCHAFIEFAGMQAKFIDMCQEALDAGIEFPFANQHSRTPWPIQRHHAEYLGEKFQCIYGFAIGPNKELRDAFIESGLGAEKQSSIERGKDDEEGSEEGIGEEDSSEEGVRSEDGRPEVTKEAGGQEEDVATVRRGERDHRGHDERRIVDARDRKEDRTRPVDGLEMAAGHLSSAIWQIVHGKTYRGVA